MTYLRIIAVDGITKQMEIRVGYDSLVFVCSYALHDMYVILKGFKICLLHYG